MLRDLELLALCLSSCPRQRVFRPVSPLPMPASHGELESQEWVSQRLTQQASPGPRLGCPAGIFHAIRVGLKASMHPPATTQEGVTLWSQPWGQNLSKTQNLHSIEWHRAEESQAEGEGRLPSVLWPGRTSDKETKEGRKSHGSSGEPRPSSSRAGAKALWQGPAPCMSKAGKQNRGAAEGIRDAAER